MVRLFPFRDNSAEGSMRRDNVPLLQAIVPEAATANAVGETEQEAVRTILLAPDRDVAPGGLGAARLISPSVGGVRSTGATLATCQTVCRLPFFH